MIYEVRTIKYKRNKCSLWLPDFEQQKAYPYLSYHNSPWLPFINLSDVFNAHWDRAVFYIASSNFCSTSKKAWQNSQTMTAWNLGLALFSFCILPLPLRSAALRPTTLLCPQWKPDTSSLQHLFLMLFNSSLQ